MKISVYRSAFNLVKNSFPYWKEALKNSCDFADEVVVCVNKCEDTTKLEMLALHLPNLKIVDADIPYSDPLLDGKLKNIALQNCEGDVFIQLDMDEYIPENQFEKWREYAKHLLYNDDVDCYMMPSLNLYKDWNGYKDINCKWYMHKRGLYRGPVNFARNKDGTVDTHKSDTCELIYESGELVKSSFFSNELGALKQQGLFVVHFGYLDLQARVDRNQSFWGEHWKTESGGKEPPHKVHMSLDEFDDEYQEHNLDIKGW